MKSLVKKLLIVALLGIMIIPTVFVERALAQAGQGISQLVLPFKDADCNGYEDITTLPLLGTGFLTRTAWGLLCPTKVDKNCDGRSDLLGTSVQYEPHFPLQCPSGAKVGVDADCNGYDDRYPSIYLTGTDYWKLICKDPAQIVDADCDGYEDETVDQITEPRDLLTPQTMERWRAICPSKTDRNCDGLADVSGNPYFKTTPNQNDPVEMNDWMISREQCPNGVRNGVDADCNGFEDTPAYSIKIKNASGQTVEQPVYLDLTNTPYWKTQCLNIIQQKNITDADCDGTDDKLKFNIIEKLGDKGLDSWAQLCSAKVDRNCDGRADLTGSEFSGLTDKNGKQIRLSEEPHHKYQCPNGINVQNRDKDCDGFDDTPVTVWVLEETPAGSGKFIEVQKRTRLDISNTDYWKNQLCKEQASGAVGSSPFGPRSEQGSVGTGARGTFACSDVGLRFDSFEAIMCSIRNLVARVVVPFAFVFATLFFMYGVIRYFMNASNEKERQQGRQFMIWSIIALFVMTAIWGIVALVSRTFGFKMVLPLLQECPPERIVNGQCIDQ